MLVVHERDRIRINDRYNRRSKKRLSEEKQRDQPYPGGCWYSGGSADRVAIGDESGPEKDRREYDLEYSFRYLFFAVWRGKVIFPRTRLSLSSCLQ